jgi:hypothetical protein
MIQKVRLVKFTISISVTELHLNKYSDIISTRHGAISIVWRTNSTNLIETEKKSSY